MDKQEFAKTSGLMRATSLLLRELGEYAGMQSVQVLLGIALQPGSSQRELCDYLGVPKASVSRLVEQLSREYRRNGSITKGPDLVQVKVDPMNRRRHELYLTARGERIIKQLTEAL